MGGRIFAGGPAGKLRQKVSEIEVSAALRRVMTAK